MNDNNDFDLDDFNDHEPESISKKGIFSRKDKLIVIVVIAVLCGAVYYITHKPVKDPNDIKIMPPKSKAGTGFVYPEIKNPPPPPPPPPTNNTLGIPSAKKIDWWDRKLLALNAPENNGAAGGSSQDTSVANKGEEAELDVITTKPTQYEGYEAAMLPEPDYLLTRDSDIPCVVADAINTQLPSDVKCTVDSNVYSKSGNVILIDKGSIAMGKSIGGVSIRYGMTRIPIIWDRVDTPFNVTVPFEGGGIDNLGRSGIEGDVDYHYWDRFVAAGAISIVQQAAQTTGQILSRGGGINVGGVSNNGAERIVESMLQQQANQPPTITTYQGQRIFIRIKKDLLFHKVYKLNPKP